MSIVQMNAEIQVVLHRSMPRILPPVLRCDTPEEWEAYMVELNDYQAQGHMAWKETWKVCRDEIDVIRMRLGFIKSPFGGWISPQCVIIANPIGAT